MLSGVVSQDTKLATGERLAVVPSGDAESLTQLGGTGAQRAVAMGSGVFRTQVGLRFDNAARRSATADLAQQNVPQKPTRDLGSRSRVERRRQRSGSHVPPVSPRFTLDQNDSPAVPPSP